MTICPSAAAGKTQLKGCLLSGRSWLTAFLCTAAAHVDHGKTTLMDRLLAHCGVTLAGEERYMDSNVLEKERGITISAKYTSIRYKGHVVNAVDTPGHADFGGEVERCARCCSGCALLKPLTFSPG